MLKKDGKRLVYMGFTAGLAATINTLAVLGIVLLKKGFGTPFLNIKYSYKYFFKSVIHLYNKLKIKYYNWIKDSMSFLHSYNLSS